MNGITQVLNKRQHLTDRIVDPLRDIGAPGDPRAYVIRSDHWDEWRAELWVDGAYVAQAHRATLKGAQAIANALLSF